MATPGQLTVYKPEYCELAHNDCLPGACHQRGFGPAGIACTDRLLLRLEKALLPVPVISYPGNGTHKFLLLRAGRERCDESLRHAGE